MEDSVKTWCSESFSRVWQELSANHQDPPEQAVIEAERCVELAAFWKLATSRTVAADSIPHESSTGERELIRELAEHCPLVASDPPELLGAIHEQFVARRGLVTTSGSRRRSPSRKSGGIYYTPQPVIDYMVRQTLGARLDGKIPEQIEHLAVLDPAAGSGAFLLCAFRYLVNWHLKWYVEHDPSRYSADVLKTEQGWKLSASRCHSILRQQLFGVDLDPSAIETARRTLWLAMCDCRDPGDSAVDQRAVWESLSQNLCAGHALLGSAFGSDLPVAATASRRPNRRRRETDARDAEAHRAAAFASSPLDWSSVYPAIAERGGFDVVIGNPPYRRERDYKRELDDIAATPLGRHRSPRMDLWYYFVHRGIELLRDAGSLSFITNAYWMQGRGAEKLIAALRDDVQLDELFLLQNQPVFEGIVARHVIFRLTKSLPNEQGTVVRIARENGVAGSSQLDLQQVDDYAKSRTQLFCQGRLHVWPAADRLLEKLNRQPRLIELGLVRQGIAENPACINRRTIERFPHESLRHNWMLGEGVFCLGPEELERLNLTDRELSLMRPYHALADLGRYWSAAQPGQRLIYATRETCPSLDELPGLRRHLARFRPIMEARRETRLKANEWWHLHWPRDERIWRQSKLVVSQMAKRPSFTAVFEPTYVSFSANVFLPAADRAEDLRYLCGLLNSRVLWAWFVHHAKHRGIGLELNGHVLEQAPIPWIDFSDDDQRAGHDEIVDLVSERIAISHRKIAEENQLPSEIERIESRIDRIVETLFELDLGDRRLVDSVIGETLVK